MGRFHQRSVATSTNVPFSSQMMTSDVVAMSVLAQVDTVWSGQESQTCASSDLSGVHWEDVVSMTQDGPLVVGRDEFGDTTIARREVSIRSLSLQSVRELFQMIKADGCACTS